MTNPQTYDIADIPPSFLKLAWNVFFASRSRGVSLDVHFPWLKGGVSSDRCWCIAHEDQAAAMLIVRNGVVGTTGGAGTPFHAIGLVCTAPNFRRRGLAGRLLATALEAVGNETPVLLWTSQHNVYEPFGFRLLDPTLVVQCALAAPASPPVVGSSDWLRERQPSLLFQGTRGLPVFVRGAERVRLSSHADVSIVVAPGSSPTALELDAYDERTVDAIVALGSENLVLNLPRQTALIGQLARRGARVSARATGIAMWRAGRVNPAEIAQWDIPLLDRF